MICRVKEQDIPAAAHLAAQLFESSSEEALAEEFKELIHTGDCALFLLSIEDRPAGFAQCQLRRDYVEGTRSSPVGYLEGIYIYILPEYRSQGHARKLLEQCEQWARKQGCTEFASDCELTNGGSLAFHLKMGFTEANRIICFTKHLQI